MLVITGQIFFLIRIFIRPSSIKFFDFQEIDSDQSRAWILCSERRSCVKLEYSRQKKGIGLHYITSPRMTTRRSNRNKDLIQNCTRYRMITYNLISHCRQKNFNRRYACTRFIQAELKTLTLRRCVHMHDDDRKRCETLLTFEFNV